MKRSFRKSKKGISTVIATIIIVAITIVMAIAVAYWALGIGGSFTRFEKLQYTYGYVTGGGANPWVINLQAQNTGTAQATISNIYLNGQPLSTYGGTATTLVMPNAMPAGSTSTFTVTLTAGGTAPWVSGMSVEVSIQTAAGNSYPKTFSLP